ncbi:glycosyltransferase family 2 protein [Candidatus Fonsibacter ubiquis]|jgi:GT2 family glycosyltransferase|uniref:glycosyltransferase family 2 protein n=1 Tax=Candidatus Fonsibacter ubiquis TaxID=1925548 RepID=UPI000C08AA19|nr:glycosyltransferase [Candidatus Fonsibacter ubiquis]
MNNFEKNITFVIVCFKSGHVIEKCIKSINSSIKIIVVENSDNSNFKNYLENKFLNVEVVIAKENLGYGKGNNLGISKVNTKYVFILNPDVRLQENTLKELYNAQLILQDNFSVLAPNTFDNYGFFSEQNNNYHDEIIEVDYVKGFAMLINLKKVIFEKIFDENFFLFLEEIDLCKRIKNSGGKIFLVKKSKVQHFAKQATENNLNIELCRNWHWMWSLFYFNYKHFGFFIAYKVIFNKFLSSLFKLFIGLLFFNKKKILIHYYRLNGLFNAFLRKRSWLRPDNI